MRKDGKPDGPAGKIPPWGLALWYVVITIVLIALWQSTLQQLTVKEIPYSEFKQRLARGEVTEVKVGVSDITGLIKSNPKLPALTNGAASLPPDFSFRATRVEDPKLVEELESKSVKFIGSRPNPLMQFILAWLVP